MIEIVIDEVSANLVVNQCVFLFKDRRIDFVNSNIRVAVVDNRCDEYWDW